MIRVGIVGVAGYGGGELVRLLSRHPEVKLSYLCSETYKGKSIGTALPNLRGLVDAKCQAYDRGKAAELCDILFLAQQNGWAMKEAPGLLDAGVKVIDLSGDFRLRTPGAYEEWYKSAHESEELLGEAVYGLPEIVGKKIAGARLVANPGCYPTGAILALAPLLKEKLVDPDTLIVDAKSGVSGAGRSSFKLEYHFPELNENMKAYNVGVHRHTPEIEQELSRLARLRRVTISFTPHLIPVTRGILTTAYAGLMGNGWDVDELVRTYRKFYKSAPFVVVLDPGDYPATRNTLGSNFCHIGLTVDPRTNRVVVISALDNLVKGMAGTAVQNMNLMCGFDEKTALDLPGVFP